MLYGHTPFHSYKKLQKLQAITNPAVSIPFCDLGNPAAIDIMKVSTVKAYSDLDMQTVKLYRLVYFSAFQRNFLPLLSEMSYKEPQRTTDSKRAALSSVHPLPGICMKGSKLFFLYYCHTIFCLLASNFFGQFMYNY